MIARGMIRSFACTVAAAMLVVGHLAAQALPPGLVPGERIALRIPPAAFSDRVADSSRMLIRLAVAERSGGAVRVNGRDDWAGAGFAPAATVQVDSVKIDWRSGLLIVSIEGGPLRVASVRIPVRDSTFIIRQIFARVDDSLVVEAAARDAVAARVFAGPFAAVPTATQVSLLQILQSNIHFGAVQLVSSEGRPYLALRVRESTYTCAGRPITDSARLGDALEEVALPLLWNVGHAAPALPRTFGFSVTVQMKQEYACGSEPAPGDSLTIYVGAGAAIDFAAGSVSGRGLIGASPVLFRGNRVTVAFSK